MKLLHRLWIALVVAMGLTVGSTVEAQLPLLRPRPAAGEVEVVNSTTHQGVEVAVDLPPSERIKNSVGRDMQGLCVFATLEMQARWSNVPELVGLIKRMEHRDPGGGWPEKLERIVEREAGGAAELVQYEGTDPAILDLAIRTGRPVGITYGYGDTLYGRKTIFHAVLLVHLDSQWAAIVDNNDPTHTVWMSRAEFLKRWTHATGSGWAYVLLAPPPPPPPRNDDP